ncbi:MAG: hypothetical protein HKN68_07875 [Saprospiraceae bacterium]|nr:hypothetical protein [Saprospiraceae bacterium]
MSTDSPPNLEPRDNTVIILYVKTRDENGTIINLDQTNIAANVTMGDTSGDALNDDDGNEQYYQTQVEKGGTVTWIGAINNVGSAKRDFVIITGITAITPPNGISTPRGGPSGGNDASYFLANIPANPTSDTVDYTVNFDVFWIDQGTDGNPVIVQEAIGLSIDPQLRIH